MFQIGELVVYGTSGICEISEITTMDIPGVPRDRQYYVLRPIRNKDGKIFTPVENQKTIMRSVITEQEAKELIHSMPELEELTVPTEKQREDKYKQAYRSCDCKEWIRMMKTIYTRKQQRIKSGRKIPATDERYMRMVSEALYAELSQSLNLDEKEIEQYITETLSR